MNNVVWHTKLDNKFNCKVERLSAYEGRLIVTRETDGKEIISKDVGLSYGAVFGPDISDVGSWTDTILEVVDKLKD